MHFDLKNRLEMYKTGQQAKVIERKPKGPDIHEVVEGTICSNDDGCFFLIENKYPRTYLHGGYSLGCVLEPDIAPVVKVCSGPGNPSHVSDYIFLDTETTGLSGGSGTVAFLIGIGFFDGDAFVLRQYLMRDYDEEPAVLRALNEVLSNCKGLVTFNGKAFDWNLLQARFISNRIRPALKNPIHIDLLYPSRMLWKLKLESCRLSSLEENILEENRVDDIPGALIPGIYFKYLDDRNAGDIKRVIKHNELDILSMVSLLKKINSILCNPLSETQDGLELLGAGRIFERCEEQSTAIDCYNMCSSSENRMVMETSMKKLANMHKRSRDYSKAVEKLELLLAGSSAPNIPVMIELAKHYEHRIKDIPKAIATVQEAVKACSEAGFLRNMYYSDLKTRLERLKRKAGPSA